eukprot:CAMPEP_0184348474 /NCGR_PEP_ID=MMETSP1089-20130417/27676_1 /TAXON_ID=38269 ORGANISM="Gloeochaete wittrockiana, Strain SAG46.84" /NCGR_SAMPLE_ID=MMETSP1089 /ASSEMBLY_ACC=CAM_ASM_000445 /LENGTH=126 /DNA_ID=CAMNT_0026680197 /DNA_START=8 /DNA_END=388 /DNA_ORIENTATION=-
MEDDGGFRKGTPSGEKKDVKEGDKADKSDKTETDPRKMMNFPLIRHVDMNPECKAEAQETIVTALEKFPNNYENVARMVKEAMDKKFGSNWHCVVGEGFGFDVTYEVQNLLYLYYGGTTAVLLFKV